MDEKIGREIVDIALTIGLVSQTKPPGSTLQQSIRIVFPHKTIQEVMAAIYLTCSKIGKRTLYLTSLQRRHEIADVIEICNVLDPSSCYDILKHILDIAKSKYQYRRTFHLSEKFHNRYAFIWRWHRKAIGLTCRTQGEEFPVHLHICDIYLNSESEPDRTTVAEMLNNLENIVSVMLWRVYHTFHNFHRPLHRILGLLPLCPKLSALCIYLRDKQDHDKLLAVLPHLTQLHTIWYLCHCRSSAYGAASVTDPVGVASIAIVKSIFRLPKLRRIFLWRVDMGNEHVAVTTDMQYLRTILLKWVYMSHQSWLMFITSLLTIEHPVYVKLENTNIDDDTINRIHTFPDFTLTNDDRERNAKGWYQLLEFITAPSYKAEFSFDYMVRHKPILSLHRLQIE